MSEADSRTATPLDKRIGQRVRTRRLELGMSQERLAELLGVTFQQVQKYEKGVNRIAVSRLADISTALEQHPGAFFDKGKFSADDDVQAALDVPGVAEALIALSKMKPNVRKKALAVLEALD